MSTKIEGLKKLSEKHMQYQLEISQILPTLNFQEFIEFNNWHKNHPLNKDIFEKFQSMRQQIGIEVDNQ